MILNILGMLVAISGACMLMSVPFSWYYQTNDLLPLLGSSLGSMILGGTVWYATQKNRNTDLRRRDGYLIVSLGWIVMSLIGAIPYVVSGAIPSYTDAFFETMSGFTTTGASILNDIESLPQGILFWRSMTHWIGGMGIIVLTIAILPLLGIGGMQLYAAEVPGPTPDKLTPRVTETARRLWAIYVSLTLLEVIFLMFGGMSFFDSVCHSMATLSTGGFSTKQASVAAFSPYIQYVVIIFMFVAGINFSLTYFAIAKQNPKRLLKNEEFRWYFYGVVALTVLVTLVVYFAVEGISLEQAFRDSLFQIVAIVTTTGFATADYTSWATCVTFLFFILLFVGGSAGSTSGGIKVVRFLVLFKNAYLEVKRQIHPKAILPVRFNGKAVSPVVVGNILAFFLLFILIFVAGSFVMAAMGLDFLTAVGAVAASLGNIGPGIGGVGPMDNYANIPDAGKWFLSFLMLLGRLELFTVLILFMPFFWRKS